MMISVGESVRFGWETFKKRPWIFIGAFVLVFILSGTLNGILAAVLPIEGEYATHMSSAMNFFISLTIGVLMEMGLLTFILRAHDDVEKVTFNDLWNPELFLSYLIAQLLVGLTVLLGFALLVIPGIVAAVGFMFTPYLILDKKMQPVEALRASWSLTKGHKWQLLLLACAVIGLNILGMLAFFVGVMVTAPISMLAVAHAYRTLTVQPVPATTP